jgi:hypothetical protein
MSLIQLLIFVVAFFGVAWLSWWVITKFLPPPVQTPALAIVGVILLIVLLVQFVPGAGAYRVWGPT